MEKIDLTELWQNVGRAVKRLWWLAAGLALVFAVRAYFTVESGYVPEYTASVTLAVQSLDGAGSYVNRETAEKMAEVFPYLMRNGVLKSAIQKDMGLDALPGTLTMAVEEGTNFLTLSAEADTADISYELLQAALRQYPEVVKFVVGRIGLEILDETGIPEDTGLAYFYRDSVTQGAAKGACFGLLVISVYALSIHTVKKRRDLRKIVNLEDLGSIPYVSAKRRRKSKKKNHVDLRDPYVSPGYLEAIRRLCMKTAGKMETEGYRSLMITSSVAGEGKTTLAMNLALAFARLGKHVILVDCDLRNPSVAKAMKEEKPKPGLGAVLRKETIIEKALADVPTERGRLQVMYETGQDREAVRLLGTEEMNSLLRKLEEYADMVILDTAPADLTADAVRMSGFVDAALYVVRCDHAGKNRIRRGVECLSESGIRILGYVFNADTAKNNGGYAYRGYGSLGRYGGYGRYYGRRGYGIDRIESTSGQLRQE